MNRLEDRQGISDVLVRYATGIDTRNWDLFRTVFTADVVADYGSIGSWQGVEAITEAMVAWQEPRGHTLHSLSNVAVDFIDTAPDQPAKARSRAMVDVTMMDTDGRKGLTARGVYEDQWVRNQTGWQISERKFTMVLLTAVTNLDR